MGTLHLAVNVLDLIDQMPLVLQGRWCLFSTQSQSGHTLGEIFFKFYLEPLTSFWQAQDYGGTMHLPVYLVLPVRQLDS